MREFFFHLRSCDGLLLDPEGTLHADVEAALDAAIIAAREIIGADIQRGAIDLDQSIVILDSSGAVLGEIEFATVFKARAGGTVFRNDRHLHQGPVMLQSITAIAGTFEATASEIQSGRAL